MPESTPALDLPYPLPVDPLVDYPGVGKDLAETLEALIPRRTRSQTPPANPRVGDRWILSSGYGSLWEFEYNPTGLLRGRWADAKPADLAELELEGEQNEPEGVDLWTPDPAELWLPDEPNTKPIAPETPEERNAAYPWEFIGGAPSNLTMNGYGGFQTGIWTTMNGLGQGLPRPGEYLVKGSYSLYAPAASFLIGVMVNYGGGYNNPVYPWQTTGNATNYFDVQAGNTLVNANTLTTTVFIGYFFGSAPTAFYASHIELIPRRIG